MFIQHKLVENDDGYDLILYLDPMLTEFSDELGRKGRKKREKTLRENAAEYIREKLPNLKIKSVKIMLGAALISTLAFAGPLAESAKAVGNTAVQSVQKQSVNLTVNGKYIPLSSPAVNRNGTVYVPVRDLANALGASVWWNAGSKTVGINKGSTKIAFVIGANTARVNGKSVSMPSSYIVNGVTMAPIRFVAESLGQQISWNDATNTVNVGAGGSVSVGTGGSDTYTVKPGDTLWKIANAHGLSVSSLQAINSLSGTTIYPGQQLVVKPGTGTVDPTPSVNTVTYKSYTVQSGDTIWDLSIKFGIPQQELLKANNLTMSSRLSVGQKLTIPVHHIAVKPTVSANHGEYLDWWSEAQYVFPINKIATVTDFKTGRSFKIKRTIGANHADCEPLTASDAAIIKEIWGGAYSWSERAVIVNVDGRKIAASMASMPHDVDYVKNNNFNGHFDLHFRNSTRHIDGTVNNAHQNQIKIAAGLV
ncbi:MAG: LysM peptidoglycan-binding domain-containing protein [Eubacteriales bacterium]|jgi:LysM repeat protein